MLTKRSLLCSLICLTLVAAPIASPAQSAETVAARVARTKVLRVGAVAAAVPYFNKDIVSGQWEGFGPDFAESLAKKLGARVEFVETTWGNAVLDLQANKIDVMFGMAPTPQRREVVGFADTLFDNTYTAVCRKGVAPATWADLDAPNVKIAVDVGSSHDQVVTRLLPKADVARLENSGAATLALQSGRADCQVLVVLLAQTLLAKRPTLGTMFIPTPVQTLGVSIGIPKEADTTFQKSVNAWLADARSRNEMSSVIYKNMEKLAGVKREAFPKEVKF